jgi:hypothetical protein
MAAACETNIDKALDETQWDFCCLINDPDQFIDPFGYISSLVVPRSDEMTALKEDLSSSILKHSFDSEIKAIMKFKGMSRFVNYSVYAGMVDWALFRFRCLLNRERRRRGSRSAPVSQKTLKAFVGEIVSFCDQ